MYDAANPHHIGIIRQRLSVERLSSYDLYARGDHAASLRLYEWNTEASAACYATLQAVEVLLRNAIHHQLTLLYRDIGLPGSWLDDQARLLEQRRLDDIAEARRRVRRNGKPATTGRIVAELPFGFWRYLLAARYEQTLWTPALRHAFPYLRPQSRRTIAQRVERLHHLRNRIAHHEPIHRRNLVADHADMLAVVAAICPYAVGWVATNSTVRQTAARRPVTRALNRDGSLPGAAARTGVPSSRTTTGSDAPT